VIDSLFVADLEVDYKELIASLRTKDDLRRVSACSATVIFSDEGDDMNVWQLSPLASVLIGLCDGRRAVAEIAAEFSSFETGLSEIPPDKACLFGLMQLVDDGFIGLSSSPLLWEERSATKPNFSLPPKAINTQQPWPIADSTAD
jgi:hypothetical protein